ncbi:unnamed protein product [Rotaria magnacalcarata]|uniref:Uncharacterized protein n=1 Tax=Rotaria magnacalcarata TaxID=392030 RepID=A0A816B0L3_9BILA|nr:unnamed protein product [Rotaria magnacalcarata]
MSRQYSSWAANQALINPDLTTMKLTTVMGNEQDQLKQLERVEAIPHMYINVDAPPPPSTATMTATNFDTQAIQPMMMSRQNSSFFAAPPVTSTPINVQTKMWPAEKPTKNASTFESASSTSKPSHKHKHHRHHHSDKHHHHHHHHSRRNRAKSAESIRNRPNQTLVSSSKIMMANPQYVEQDQQQQQSQQMVVYREVPNGEGYTVDPNGLATVPYQTQNETVAVDDQQTPCFVYRDGNFQQQPQSIVTDGIPQQIFYNQDQDTKFIHRKIPLHPIQNQMISHRVASCNETQVGHHSPHIYAQPPLLMKRNSCTRTGCNVQEIERIYVENDCCCCRRPTSTMNCTSDSCFIQQADGTFCLSQQQQPSQIVYCTEPNQHEYHCTSNNNNNIIQQTTSPRQQQFVYVDNLPTSIQPTIINQIPAFNSLSTNSGTASSIISLPQSQLQRATSFLVQQQPQPQQLQIIQQPQSLQVLQQHQPMQIIQQPQPLQVIQSAQPQFLQIASPTSQAIQAQPILQTLQIPTSTVVANPQILYQRPYDPIVMPVQNQQMAIANPNVLALSQPSYAPSRVMPSTQATQPDGANMFRHALIRTVAGRTGLPVPPTASNNGAIQLMQPTATVQTVTNPNLLLAGGVNRSGSLPIIPLTPGGLLIPFQSSETPGLRSGPLLRAGGYGSNLQNFTDIQQQIDQKRAQLTQSLQQAVLNKQRSSPPIISAAARNQNNSYASGNIFATGARPGGTTGYDQSNTTGISYSQPSFAAGNIRSNTPGPSTGPYFSLRP